ncbi:MAG TPA: ABC transporter permease [Pseudobdellovibrionaceae bacterium]|nr:ABC transporter permease [Pseudobdellovibrionaceae bacterium]
MIFFRLALKSLRNRFTSTVLTVLSISLSVTLLLAVERTKRAAEEGFTQSVSQVDLLVGGRTGPVNLILYSVFNMGSASNNISWESYQEIKNLPEVAWTIPYSLGDGHRGFRVVATDENFYEHYRFRGNQKVELLEGQPALDVWDVVLGSDVYKKLKYKVGEPVVIAHGVTRGEGLLFHDDKPFRVVGILQPTGTALDQSLYISLYGMEAIHIDWKYSESSDSKKENSHTKKASSQTELKKENIKIGPITSFFLRTKSRVETLRLQRFINNYTSEPLLAIIPGVTLSELWGSLSQIDVVLKIISFMVLIVGLAAMVSTILAGLNERRREMSILRSLGAGPLRLTSLLVFESCLLTSLAILVGVIINSVLFLFLSGWLANQFGFYIQGSSYSKIEFIYLALIWLFGTLVGFIPAIKASRLALKDGLSVRV